jgi:acetylornithine deacetylase/succinyl-diaminopimelate desuccinylase-like protein
MFKKNSSLFQALALSLILYGIFYFMMPHGIDVAEAPVTEFSTQRALRQVKAMTVKPHFVGSENHEEVALYVQGELKKMGLETSLQEGFSMTFRGTLTKPKNILARIKGSASTKALLLLAHYDSAPHSFSLGAGDDASGVATVLEGVRAFLQSKTPHKNDIIILLQMQQNWV